MHADLEYAALLRRVLEEGEHRADRTGTGTISRFGERMVFDLTEGFPAITTKKLAWKAVVGELLWFLEGSNSNIRLAELTHGDGSKPTIWTANAESDYWKTEAKFEGDLGRVYGVQWRTWKSYDIKRYREFDYHPAGEKTFHGAAVTVKEHDQIANIIHQLKTDPTSRRMILSAYNVGELDQMALPPCHMFAQYYVSQDQYLDSQVYIRSNDLFLGAPFNIASYALLQSMLAAVTKYLPRKLVIVIGDAHIYKNHYLQVEMQLDRAPRSTPSLRFSTVYDNIDSFRMEDIHLVDYVSHDAIKAPMAV